MTCQLLRHICFATIAIFLFSLNSAQAQNLTGPGPDAPQPDAKVEPKETDQALPEQVNDGPVYVISKFELSYFKDKQGLPSLESLNKTKIGLAKLDTGWGAPRAGQPVVAKALEDWSKVEDAKFHASAIQALLVGIRDELINRKLMGIYVGPDPRDIDQSGQDLRSEGRTTLRLVITLGEVTQVNTEAFGARIKPEDRLNNPKHARIARKSPVQPVGAVGSDGLIHRDALDRYALRLSRHPGRRVDVALAPSPEIGGVELNYQIFEVKPWLVYGEISNTGTRNTNKLREQFGFRHYNLTNRDDILGLDYSTAGFQDTHSVFAFYETRVGGMDRVRVRLFGSWSTYSASDVGIFSDTFEGDSWQAGAELIVNAYQYDAFFLDVVVGARYQDIETNDTLPGTVPGDESFFIPRVELRAEHQTDWTTFFASVGLEYQNGDITDASRASLVNLGRPSVEEDWLLLTWDASFAFYLEPVLMGDAWRDPSTPRSSTLAHELYFSARGQHTFGDRVPPQFQNVIGGLYSVRGYEQSIASGDTTYVGTMEYRFHVPKFLPLQPEPRQVFGRPFRTAPQYVYGPTDWDLILKAFVDAGHVINHSGSGGITTDATTLLGTGVGLELQIKRNITARVDWAFALNEIDGLVSSGSSQVYFQVRILY